MATELHQEGGRFSMVKVPEKILALFKMLGILDVVSVFDSEKEAFQALGELVKPPPTPISREFPLLIRCIACRRKIELPAAGYFRCPRCGACFSVKSEGKVKGYQIDQPQSIELRLPCLPDSSPTIHEASASLSRQKEFPREEWKKLENVLERACTLAWNGAGTEERCSVYLVADRKEFRAAIKVDHPAFNIQGDLQEIRPMVDEMDVVTLPAGSQILKFTKKIRRDGGT
jgi:DNA-directed RNA polymerase subunit RPC12/RpoP